MLGEQRGEGARFLTPVPVGAVIYGSGSAAVALTKVRGYELLRLC